MRVLGAIRQSKTKDRAVSPATQRAAITRWADEHGHEVVKFTVDLSQSGKLSAFKRPELGPWLTDPDKIVAFDILVTTKIDRACRNTRNFLELMDWCADVGKVYVSLKENIDMSTVAGREYARQAASRAEWERDMASERSLETRAELEGQGRWTGGRIAYGYRADERDDGYYVVPDEGGTAEIARRMAGDAIAGKSNGYIQRWLNAEGIPTGTGKTWLVETVRQILISDNMAGLLDEDIHAALRASLRSRRQTRGQWTSGAHTLLRVAFCSRCSDESRAVPLYGSRKGDRADRYRCVKCNTSVRKDWLESQTEAELRARWGNHPYAIPHIVPGDDNSAEIKRLSRQLRQAEELEFVDTSALEARIAELRALPHEPDRVEYEPTGKTIAEHWDSLDKSERGAFLRENQVCVRAGTRTDAHGKRHPVFTMENTFRSAMAAWRQPA